MEIPSCQNFRLGIIKGQTLWESEISQKDAVNIRLIEYFLRFFFCVWGGADPEKSVSVGISGEVNKSIRQENVIEYRDIH